MAETTSGDATLDAAIAAAQDRVKTVLTNPYDQDMAVQALDAVAVQVAAAVQAAQDAEA